MSAELERPKAKRLAWGMPGSRVARKTAMTVFASGARRPVIVTIYPDGLVGLRLAKHRREEFLCADVLYKQAVVERVAYERVQKRKAKKGARS